ncbi:unnamed protein product [Absidia cylindrospora]
MFNACFDPYVKKYSRQLRQNGISTRTDDSKASIGRRYARNDELGIPFAIAVDFKLWKTTLSPYGNVI